MEGYAIKGHFNLMLIPVNSSKLSDRTFKNNACIYVIYCVTHAVEDIYLWKAGKLKPFHFYMTVMNSDNPPSHIK